MSRKLFLSLGLAPPVLAAILLAASAVGSSHTPPQPTVPVTVTISSAARMSGGDPDGPPDYFAKVFIAGQWFTSGTISDQNGIAPNDWTFTVPSISRVGGKIPIRIELWDEDPVPPNSPPNTPPPNELVDIDPLAPGCNIIDLIFGCANLTIGGANPSRPAWDLKGLDLNYDPLTRVVSGDVTPSTAPPCQTGTEAPAAMICFSVTTGPNDPIVVTKTADTIRFGPDGVICTINDCSLREAIEAAFPGDTIVFATGGLYQLQDQGGWGPGHLIISRKVKIEGPATGTPVVIEQTAPGVRVFEIGTSGDLELSNVTITGGEAGPNSEVVSSHIHGGGIHNHGKMTLRNVTLTGNSANSTSSSGVGGGAAIYNAGGTTSTLQNVTIANNDALVRGGGIGGPGAISLENTLLVGNTTAGQEGNCSTEPTDPAAIANNGGNMQFPGGTCGFGPTRTPVSSPIGLLAANGTYPLPPGSPAIDAGSNATCRPKDQTGTMRPLDGNGDSTADCDVGSREYNPTGANVKHQPVGPGGSRPVELTFDDVTTPGATMLTVSGSGPARPMGYRQGSPATNYSLATTAVYTGSINVCIDYTGQSFPNESRLRVLHHTGAAWVDKALSLDVVGNIACGRTSTLGLFAVFQVNQVPVASIAEPPGGYRLNEGGSVVLQGSGSDPDGDSLTYEWSPATELNDRTLAAPTFSPRDDGTRTYTLVVRDGEASSAPASTTVQVDNVAPSLTLTGPADGALYRVGSVVAVSATFTDQGVDDVHTCKIDWDDGTALSAGTVTESNGAGSCVATRTFTSAGIYTLQVTIDDGDGGATTASTMVVVYDPKAGYVLGGGHVASPPGAYRPNPSWTGTVAFSFVAQYLTAGSSVPTGTAAVVLPGASFVSTSLQWLVVTGFKSQFRGVGRINGLGDYGFLLTAYDGQQPGGGGSDRVRVKIWNRLGGAVVYDNMLDPTATDDIDRAKPQQVGVGSAITIFKI